MFRPVTRNRVSIDVFGESRTVQADGERTDIRNIVKRAMRGNPVAVNLRQGFFCDISNAPTFIEALNIVAGANELFSQLPAKVRDRFANDPAKMLAFLDDPSNLEEAIKLGLAEKKEPAKEPAPMKVEVVNPVLK